MGEHRQRRGRGLGGYGYEEIYVVKPEFTQHFKHDEEEVPPNDESE